MFFRFQGGPNSTTLTEFDKKHHNLWCLNHSSAVRRAAMRRSAKKGQNSAIAAATSAEPSTKTAELLEASNALAEPSTKTAEILNASYDFAETQSSILPTDTSNSLVLNQNVEANQPNSILRTNESLNMKQPFNENQNIAERGLDQNISTENQPLSKNTSTQKLSVRLNMEATTFEPSSPLASSTDQSGKHIFAI